jgi:hypothetical protein
MTVQDIITEVRGIVQEKNAANAHKSDTSIVDDINSCTLQLCSNIATLPKVPISNIVAADTINLPSNLLKMDYISIADATGKKTPLETIDFVNFARITPDWENAVDGKPERLVRMTDLTWMMFPNPDSTWTGKALNIIGTVLPTPLALTTDVPPVSIVLHPAYAHYCAWKYFLVLNNPERAGQEYATFEGLRKMNMATATSTTGSQIKLNMRGYQ